MVPGGTIAMRGRTSITARNRRPNSSSRTWHSEAASVALAFGNRLEGLRVNQLRDVLILHEVRTIRLDRGTGFAHIASGCRGHLGGAVKFKDPRTPEGFQAPLGGRDRGAGFTSHHQGSNGALLRL